MVHYTTFTNLRVTGDFDADNAFNASALPVTATGGTTARTLAARFAEPLSVKDFGAVGDGVTNDSAAFSSALSVARRIRVPAGSYLLSSEVTAVIGSFLEGDGPEVTKLLVTGTNGITFDGLTTWAVSGIRDLSIIRTGTGGHGVKFNGTWVRQNTFVAENLRFRGTDALSVSAHYFDKYIWLLNGRGATFKDIHVWGNFNPNNNPVGQAQSVGIYCDGDATGVNNNIGMNFDQCNISSVYTGIYFADGCEGFWVGGSEMVGCRTGVLAGAGGTDPGGWINALHTNCTYRGVKMTNKVGIVIDTLSAYRSDDFYNNASEDWAGIELSGCVRANITSFDAAPQPDGVTAFSGITLSTCQGIVVNGATMRDTTTGLETSACNDVIFNGIIFNGSAGPTITSAFKVSATCNDIFLNSHSFIGTNPTTKYDVSAAASPYRIFVQAPRPKYNGVSSTQSISAAATNLLTLEIDPQVNRFSLGAGAGPYTYNIDLDTAGALQGDVLKVWIAMPSSTNATAVFRNGSGGATLHTLNTASATRYACEFVYTGSAWVVFQISVTLI